MQFQCPQCKAILASDGVTEGMQVVDRGAPINVGFAYELLMMTRDGRLSVIRDNLIQFSEYWYVYWGDQIARAYWNPNGQISLKRPEKTRVRYSGREYPVTYDSKAIEESFSFSFVLVDRDELDNFRHMIRDGGTGIWKSANGDVYDADFEFDYTAAYYENTLRWNCNLSVTRIDGE